MTRDEAIAKLREVVTSHGGAVTHKSVEMSVDGYAALGLLKLDVVRPLNQRIDDFYVDIGSGDVPYFKIEAALKKHKLSIVPA